MDYSDKIIPGYGPSPCDVAFFGEAPGRDEYRLGRPFVGKAGEVFTAYTKAAGLDRARCWVSNIYKCWPGPGNPMPTAEQIHGHGGMLRVELHAIKPKYIATLGAVATRVFLGSEIELETAHGIPHFSVFANALVVPCYHPAAGFYEPQNAAYCQDDIFRFAKLIQSGGKGVWREGTGPAKAIPISPGSLPVFGVGNGIDTEGTPRRPWGLSLSPNGKASFVSRGSSKAIGYGPLTFHNALYDLPVMRSMGIDTKDLVYDDTIVLAFDLQLEPQALKRLAYRHLGWKMREYDDVVRPYYNEQAFEWFAAAACLDYEKPEPELKEDPKTGRLKVYQPQSADRRILNICQAFLKDKSVKPEKRWTKLEEGMRGEIEEKMGEEFPRYSEALFLVPEEEAVQYSGEDAAATKALKPILDQRIKDRGLQRVAKIDTEALPYIDRMQEVGMPLDMERLQAMREELAEIVAKKKKELRKLTGWDHFNPGSSEQVASAFRGYDLPVIKLTEGGDESTDDKVLSTLRGRVKDPEALVFIDGVMDYREAQTYLVRYVLPVIHFAIARNGEYRLYPKLRTTRVVSGRLSSGGMKDQVPREPNVLAMPVRTSLGKKVRACFVARPGKVILSVDLSQIELRVMAHESQDSAMMRAFLEDRDLHAETASFLFSIVQKAISEAQRYSAKTLNFAIMYGITARALLEQLYAAGIYEYTLSDCERFIKRWFELYPGVLKYLRVLWKQAEKDGFVRDWTGRIRYTPNIRLPEGPAKAAARRDIGNLPIQAGAHAHVKIAEPRVLAFLKEAELYDTVLPILQIHDELLFECPEDEKELVGEVVGEILCAEQARVSVPLKAKAKWGPSWGELKEAG